MNFATSARLALLFLPLTVGACAAAPKTAKPPVTTSATLPATAASSDEAASAKESEASSAPRAHRVSALEGVVTFTMKAVRPPRVKTVNDKNGEPRSTIDVDLSDKHAVTCNVVSGGLRAALTAVREGSGDLAEGQKAENPTVDVTAIDGRAVIWTTTAIRGANGENVGTRDVAVAVRPRFSLFCKSARGEENARFRAFIEEALTTPKLDPPDAASPRRVILYKLTSKGKVVGYDEGALYDEPDGTLRSYGRAAWIVTLEKGGTAGVDTISSALSNKRGEELSYDYDRFVNGKMFETLHLKRDGVRGYTLNGLFEGKALETKLTTKTPFFATETPAWQALLAKVQTGKAREARFSVFQQSKAIGIPVVVKRKPSGELSYMEADRDVTVTFDASGAARWQSAEDIVAERIYVGGSK